jgi:hypothetical protein
MAVTDVIDNSEYEVLLMDSNPLQALPGLSKLKAFAREMKPLLLVGWSPASR